MDTQILLFILMELLGLIGDKKVGDSEWAKRTDVIFVANFVAIVIK